MENAHVRWKNPLNMAIFHSYVRLPEGTLNSSLLFQAPFPVFSLGIAALNRADDNRFSDAGTPPGLDAHGRYL